MRKEGEASGGRRRLSRLTLATALTSLLLVAAAGVGVVSYRNTITPSGIVIHHSALPPLLNGVSPNARLIDEIHRRRGFNIFYWGRFYHIGYHYIILPDGTVQQGRPEHCQGAHTVGYNSYIGICLIGNFSTGDNPNGERGPLEPTAAQMRALIDLTARLRARYAIPLDNVIRHHDVNPDTECPGDRFPFAQFVEQLREGETQAH
jgi:hypothetical protein